MRDVRGFATKFYTNEGNFDLVGNNIPVFFIQDAIKVGARWPLLAVLLLSMLCARSIVLIPLAWVCVWARAFPAFARFFFLCCNWVVIITVFI